MGSVTRPRFAFALACSVGFLAVAAGISAAPDAATRPAATHGGAGAVTLTLEKVVVDGRGHASDPNWTFSEQGGSATYALAPNQSTYAWTMPATVTATGAKVSMTVTAKAAQGSRFAPAMSVAGALVKEGTVVASTLAESGQSMSSTKTATLVPNGIAAGGKATVVVGLQDGPLYTYTYVAGSGGGSQSADCSKVKTQSVTGPSAGQRLPTGRKAINEVRVVCVQPDVQYHREGAPDEEWLAVEKGTVLKQGDEISCDPDGIVVLAFADNSTVTLRNTTQLKIASFFTEGGVVRTEILLKMGEVAAKVNKSEATKSDFQIDEPTATASVRGTIFTVFYDPVAKASVTSVTQGVVSVDPKKAGLPTVDVGAGKEVQVTATAESKIAPIGHAGVPAGAVGRSKARQLVLAQVAKSDERCKIKVLSFGLVPAVKGWKVSVKVSGGKKGWAVWQVKGALASASNPVAKAIAGGCR